MDILILGGTAWLGRSHAGAGRSRGTGPVVKADQAWLLGQGVAALGEA